MKNLPQMLIADDMLAADFILILAQHTKSILVYWQKWLRLVFFYIRFINDVDCHTEKITAILQKGREYEADWKAPESLVTGASLHAA